MKKFISILFFILSISINSCWTFQITNNKDNKKDLSVLLNYKSDDFYFCYKLKIGEIKKLDFQKNGKNLNEIRIYDISLSKEIIKKEKINKDFLNNYEKLLLMTIYKKEIIEKGEYLITNDGESLAQEGVANTEKK